MAGVRPSPTVAPRPKSGLRTSGAGYDAASLSLSLSSASTFNGRMLTDVHEVDDGAETASDDRGRDRDRDSTPTPTQSARQTPVPLPRPRPKPSGTAATPPAAAMAAAAAAAAGIASRRTSGLAGSDSDAMADASEHGSPVATVGESVGPSAGALSEALDEGEQSEGYDEPPPPDPKAVAQHQNRFLSRVKKAMLQLSGKQAPRDIHSLSISGPLSWSGGGEVDGSTAGWTSAHVSVSNADNIAEDTADDNLDDNVDDNVDDHFDDHFDEDDDSYTDGDDFDDADSYDYEDESDLTDGEGEGKAGDEGEGGQAGDGVSGSDAGSEVQPAADVEPEGGGIITEPLYTSIGTVGAGVSVWGRLPWCSAGIKAAAFEV